MAIRYKCGCGAYIKLPETAAGRKARCKACGEVFTVPAAAANPAVHASAAKAPAPSRAGDEASWLMQLSESEANAAGELVRPSAVTLNIDDDEPVRRNAAAPYEPPREDRDWISGPQRSFWEDLLSSFVFILDGGNVVVFVVMLCVSLFGMVVDFAPGFLSLIGNMLIGGYFCAFYMSTILEVASGEDELPSVSISNIGEDILMPLVRYVGTWAMVLLPALATLIFAAYTSGDWDEFFSPDGWHWTAALVLGVGGLALWPVVVLCVAIGGGFSGLWPHTIIRTALSAPLQYLAILSVLLVAVALTFALPLLEQYAAFTFPGPPIAAGALQAALSLYAMIVAMRAIGLFYRHCKHKFPWAAE